MTDWIADAEAGSSVRAKLNALMIPISSVAISSPVEYIDIALPSGYDKFILEIDLLRVDVAASISASISLDSGVSFPASGFFPFQQLIWYVSGANGGSAADGYVDSVSALAALSLDGCSAEAHLPFQATVTINPGSVADYPLISCVSLCEINYIGPDPEAPVVFIARDEIINTFYNQDTPPPTLGRHNLFRVLPTDNGGPLPISGTNFTAGTFHLFGIPTP